MHLRYFSILVFNLLLLQLTVSSQSQLPTFDAKSTYHPNKVVVKFKSAYSALCSNDRVSIHEFNQFVASSSSYKIQRFFPTSDKNPSRERNPLSSHNLDLIYELSLDKEIDLIEFIKVLNARAEIQYAEPKYIHELLYHPNDPLADTLNNTDIQPHLDQIHAREAWELQRNDTSIIVGVVDAGFSLIHGDVQKNLFRNYADPIDGKDNDLDGYIDNYTGWDFGGEKLDGIGDNDPSFRNDLGSSGQNHGAHVAGILAADTDNGIGVAGVGFNCKYIPIKSSSDSNPTSISFGYQGIIYAIQQGAQIINCSWGSTAPSNLGRDVVDYAVSRGIAIIAACGNSSRNEPFYPAAFDGVLSVANVQRGDTLATSSTYHHTVGVSAPGTSIVGPINHSGYGPLTGTSFASPVAAGALAIVLGYHQTYSPIQALQRLRITADDIDSVNLSFLREKIGKGRINVERALTDPPTPSIRKRAITFNTVFSSPNNILPGDTVDVGLALINFLSATEKLEVSASFPEDSAFVQLLNTSMVAGKISTMETVSIPASPSGIRFILNADIPVDHTLLMRLEFKDEALGYLDYQYVQIRANPSYLDVSVNNLHTSVSSLGNFGFRESSIQKNGKGIIYHNFPNALFAGGLVLGESPTKVSANLGSTNNYDFTSSAFTKRVFPSQVADFESIGVHTDRTSLDGLGVDIIQKTYAFNDPLNEDYIIFQYIISNDRGATLDSIYLGLYADWDITDNPQYNTGDFNLGANLAYTYAYQSNYPYYGMSILSNQTPNIFSADNRSFSYSNQEVFFALSAESDSTISRLGIPSPDSELSDSNESSKVGYDILQFISTGPLTLQTGEKDTITFAILAQDSLQGLLNARQAAWQNYYCKILNNGPNNPFSLTKTFFVQGDTVELNDLNVGSSNWLWDLGNGDTSAEKSIDYVYTTPGDFTISLTVTDSICVRKYESEITVDALTTITELGESNKLLIYPNPVKGDIYIKSTDSQIIEKVSLYNLMGRSIITYPKKEVAAATPLKIDVSNLSSGMYILTVEGSDKKHTQKILIH